MENVSDWQRVNVSFTRARRGFIVVGNNVIEKGEGRYYGSRDVEGCVGETEEAASQCGEGTNEGRKEE